MASKVASTALMTDAQPLIPQAQGTYWSACLPRMSSAAGNGIPMQNASGEIRTMLNTIFNGLDIAANETNSGLSKNR